MCGSPSVGSQWRGFLCSLAAVFSPSPSQLISVPCTGASPPCGTLPKTVFWIQPERRHFQQKRIHTLGCRSGSLVLVDLESNQAPCLSAFVAQMNLFPYQLLAHSQGNCFLVCMLQDAFLLQRRSSLFFSVRNRE